VDLKISNFLLLYNILSLEAYVFLGVKVLGIDLKIDMKLHFLKILILKYDIIFFIFI